MLWSCLTYCFDCLPQLRIHLFWVSWFPSCCGWCEQVGQCCHGVIPFRELTVSNVIQSIPVVPNLGVPTPTRGHQDFTGGHGVLLGWGMQENFFFFFLITSNLIHSSNLINFCCEENDKLNDIVHLKLRLLFKIKTFFKIKNWKLNISYIHRAFTLLNSLLLH